jgi:hypothetical protein
VINMARSKRNSSGPSQTGVSVPNVTATDSETDVINLGQSDTEVGALTEPMTRRTAVGRSTLVWRRMRRMPSFWIGGSVLVLLVLAAIFMPMVYQYTPIEYDYANQLKGPSQYHWLGTNAQGQDLFAQIMVGLRISLVVGFGTAIVVTVLAAFFGTLAGYFGGALDWGVVNLINFLLVVPSLLMMLLLSPILQGAHWILMVPLLAIFSWMLTARVLRALTQGLVNMEYVQAAKFMGVPKPASRSWASASFTRTSPSAPCCRATTSRSRTRGCQLRSCSHCSSSRSTWSASHCGMRLTRRADGATNHDNDSNSAIHDGHRHGA